MHTIIGFKQVILIQTIQFSNPIKIVNSHFSGMAERFHDLESLHYNVGNVSRTTTEY